MKKILVTLLALGVVGLAIPGFADDGTKTASSSSSSCAICSKTTSNHWGMKTGSQLARGVANTGCCWMEMVRQPMKEAHSGGNVLVGVGKGVGHTCLRLVKGVGEIVTAPLPKAKDGSQIATDCPACMWNT